MNKRGLLILVALLLISIAPVAAFDVVVFDTYRTTATVDGDTIKIERDLRIRNVGQTPIIPGELHFRLHEQDGNDRIPIEVTGFTAQTETGQSLPTRTTTRNDETDLSVQLWNPLLPGFSYDFTMEYEMDFNPSGLLFYEIRLPREETTIPIANDITTFALADKYYVTYAPEGDISKLSGNTVIEWDQTSENRVVEYSRLPLPRTGMRAVNVFWIIVILVLLAVFVISLRRTRGGGGSRNAGGGQQQYQQQYQQPQQFQQRPPQFRQQPPRRR